MTELRTEELIPDIPGRADGTPLDLVIERGQRWGLLGPNGAGKTTLLHTLAGLRRPRRGVIRLAGTPLDRLRRKRIARSLGLVLQDNRDAFPSSVLETALIGRHPHLRPWDFESLDDRSLARRSLARVGLADHDDRPVATLSGGERQRLALATALTQEPDIHLLDEPTSHLDLRQQIAVLGELAAEAERGRAVVMALHDVNLAAHWCDRVLLLYGDDRREAGPAGELLTEERLSELYGHPLRRGRIAGQTAFVPAVDTPDPRS